MWKQPGIKGPVSVTFARDGRLFVANVGGPNVGIYAPPYTGAPTVVTSGITDPQLIALAPNDTLFVANRTGAHVARTRVRVRRLFEGLHR